jgi:hypothetical protein
MTNSRREAPEGYRWVCCPRRRVKNSDRYLEASDYGYEAWCFLVPSR